MIILSVISVINFLISFFCDDVEFQVYAVSERQRRQDAFEIGNKKRNNEFIRKMKKKCIGTQLCGPQTCVPMFLFVILSFFVIFVAKGVEGNAYLLEF